MAEIVDLLVQDIRFPTSLQQDGSDASHPDPDYSAVYVQLLTDTGPYKGCGMTFTIGRGNELVMQAVDALRFLVVGQRIQDIQDDMAQWIRSMAHDSQLRWLGPEKGVMHLALAAIVNAFWDLWAKMEQKPVWKLLVDMSPEQLVSLIDFRYLEDCISADEALNLLRSQRPFHKQRMDTILKEGFPSYTTQVGWLGYPDDKIRTLCRRFLDQGFTRFKLKVGSNLQDDIRRLRLIRECVGWECDVMVDANQKWGVTEAIDWMRQLATFKPLWIEEPTSPDDVLGHLAISQALRQHGIGVASGEMCQNVVMFKQFLQSGALQFCQIDSARMAGVNDVLAVYLMASKLKIPVCPHAGGVGLCEMVQHLQVFDYIALSGTMHNRTIEFIDHLHEHFLYPPIMRSARYFPPLDPGYSTEMKSSSLSEYQYPGGSAWTDLFRDGRYRDPSLEQKRFQVMRLADGDHGDGR